MFTINVYNNLIVEDQNAKRRNRNKRQKIEGGHIKAITDAYCSPITIRRHLQEKGLKTTSPPTPQTCPFGICKGAPNMGH